MIAQLSVKKLIERCRDRAKQSADNQFAKYLDASIFIQDVNECQDILDAIEYLDSVTVSDNLLEPLPQVLIDLCDEYDRRFNPHDLESLDSVTISDNLELRNWEAEGQGG